MDEKELLLQIGKLIAHQTEQISHKMESMEQRINLQIENEVSKKIEILFDGYKLTHEKQWDLERKLEALERRIEELEVKVS